MCRQPTGGQVRHEGTLESEKPIPIQLDFMLCGMLQLADAEPAIMDPQRTRPRRSEISTGMDRTTKPGKIALGAGLVVIAIRESATLGGHDDAKRGVFWPG
jgi:hypothetical protein